MTSSRSSRSSGIQPYNIRLNGSGPPPVSKAHADDPAAKLTNKLDNNINYHQSSPTLPPNIKIIVMGGFGTGKTSLMDQFTEQHQPDTYRPTKKPHENEYKCTFTLDARRVYNLEVTDTEGLDPDSEFPRHLLPQDNRHFAYLVVFSVSHYGSFKLAENMLHQLVTSIDYNTEIPIILVGNKSDIPTKKDEGFRFYTTDKAKTELKQWIPEQERRHRLAFDFYDSDIHDEYRQVQQEEAWKLALKYNIKYKEVTAKCYADVVNVFVEVVTQNDKHSNHRRRMEIDNDLRLDGKQCDFTSTSPQKRRKYFETMKLELELRMREYQTRLNLGNIDKNELRTRKEALDSWMTVLRLAFNRMNSIYGMMYPHTRELHLIEGRGVREVAPNTDWIECEDYPPAVPEPYVGRKSKDPSTSSEGRVDILEKIGLSGGTNAPKNLTSSDLMSRNAKVSNGVKFFGSSSKKLVEAKSVGNTSMSTRSHTSSQEAKHAEKSHNSSSGKTVKSSSSTKTSKITASGDSKSSKSSNNSKFELKSSKLSNCKNNTSNTSSSNDRSNNSDSNSNSNSTTLLTSTPRSSPLSSPSKAGNTPVLPAASSSSSSKKSKKSKNSSSPTKNSRTRTNNSTSSRPSPNGTRRRRSDSQGSFRTFSGVLDMFKNFPERLIGKVS